jgi:hypothetical protein
MIDEVTVDCLTRPYDRELVRCIEETGQSRACLAEFRLRKTGPAQLERKESPDLPESR